MKQNNSHAEGTYLPSDDWSFIYYEKSTPQATSLDYLSYGKYLLKPGAKSDEINHSVEETLLFSMQDGIILFYNEKQYNLDFYDVAYIPRGALYSLANNSSNPAQVIICRAAADNTHPFYHVTWKKVLTDSKRIRILDKKKVFLMFDISESADRLIAGYTIYEPFTRAFPPHNHTDQEEVYIFTNGHGSMEVYRDEKSKTFVTSVRKGDAVTIPVMNYHPVFSQDEELHFIWCIAGKRYWVGDKNKQFMDASAEMITT